MRSAFVRMNALEVCKNNVAVEGVTVLFASVFDNCSRHVFLVVAAEVSSTSRARHLVGHALIVGGAGVRRASGAVW
jgi:hypothetical protein